ncbi:hypothetical protein HYR69_05440 [Candidatus Sumerlaeota bacterium]|nr:hypothetical protein [Candidatus Sumerlaeota bacterium]
MSGSSPPINFKSIYIIGGGIIFLIAAIVAVSLFWGDSILEALAANDPSEHGKQTYAELRAAKEALALPRNHPSLPEK